MKKLQKSTREFKITIKERLLKINGVVGTPTVTNQGQMTRFQKFVGIHLHDIRICVQRAPVAPGQFIVKQTNVERAALRLQCQGVAVLYGHIPIGFGEISLIKANQTRQYVMNVWGKPKKKKNTTEKNIDWITRTIVSPLTKSNPTSAAKLASISSSENGDLAVCVFPIATHGL
jgi:hypothetical protein